jgi:ABC-type multidrug transport system fused ATPase/permease subunit
VPSSKSPLRLSSLRKLLGLRTIGWLIAGFVFSLVLSFVELGIAGFLQLFMSSIGILGPNVQVVSWLGGHRLSPSTMAVSLLTIAAVRGLSQFLLGYSAAAAQETTTMRLRRLAVWEMLLHPSRAFVSAASITTRLSEHFVKASIFAYYVANLLTTTVQVVALFTLMSVSAIRETAVATAGLLVLGVAIMKLNRASGRRAAQVPVEMEILTRGIQRVARNFFLVRAVRTERLEHERLAGAIDRYAREAAAAGQISAVASALTPFVGTVLILAIVIVSQTVFHTPGIRLVSFLYLFMRFVQGLGNGVFQLTQCNQYLPQFTESVRFVERFDDRQMAAAMGAGELTAASVPVLGSEGALRVPPPAVSAQELSFCYAGDERPVLRSLSFEVKAGAQFAVVGPSGSGKSTLLALVLGLASPTKGTLTLDGHDPDAYFNVPGARVGYVGADPFLLAGSVRENLSYGATHELDDEALWSALDAARVREAISALPKGLDHPIGEDGSGLSAGQKQRLCLARALLMRPSILVLDEVSANLDEATEAQLAETLRGLRGSVTVFLVSHRPGILVHADERLVLAPS